MYSSDLVLSNQNIGQLKETEQIQLFDQPCMLKFFDSEFIADPDLHKDPAIFYFTVCSSGPCIVEVIGIFIKPHF